MRENDISREIVDCAIEVHRTLGGPGLLASVYEEALAWELRLRGTRVRRRLELPIHYKGELLGETMRIDLLVEEIVIVSCKAVAAPNPIFPAQLRTYLKLTGMKLGLVLNFGQVLMKDGIERVVNGL